MSWINNGLTVCASAFAGAYMIMGLFVVFGRLQDWTLRRLERRRWVTTYSNECPNCKRKEVRRTGMYDADLGWDCITSYEWCFPCVYHTNRQLEINLDTMSLDEIKALVPESFEEPQVSALRRPTPQRFGDGLGSSNVGV